jgi:Ca2+-binding EF-hand superfamily protein
MKWYCAAVVLLSGLCTVLVVAGPPSRKVPPEVAVLAPDVQDIVYFAENRPALLRLHIMVDGKPFRNQWEAFIDQVFRYLDVDGDGVLNEREAGRVPPAAVLFGGNNFAGFGPVAAQPDFKTLDRDGDGKVSRDELARYYMDNGVLPFQVLSNANPNRGVRVVDANTGRFRNEDGSNAEALNKAIFDLLDTNKDGKLSREELAAAPKLLLKLDANDDEMITPDELMRTGSAGNDAYRFAIATPASMPRAKGNESILVVTPGCGPELARQLQTRYGKTANPKPDLKLTRAQLGLDAETFNALDTNQDGFLDATELAKFADRAPDLELKVSLGTAPMPAPPTAIAPPPPPEVKKRETFKEAFARMVKKAQEPEEPMVFEVVTGAPPNSVGVEVLVQQGRKAPLADAVTAQKGGPLVQLGRTRLDFQPGNNNTGMGSFSIARPNLLQQYLNAFKALDTTNKGYITEQEARGNPLFRAVFKLMDRDGDGMLYEKEIREYLSSMKSLESAAARASVTMNTSDKGRGLFDLIDKDHDGRLSVREMRQMTDLLKTLDVDGKGAFTRGDVPRHLQVGFQIGSGGGFNGGAVFVVSTGLGGGRPMPQTPRKGPEWFQKMDRNGDGDVSRREFLGTDAQFKEIDTDGDGLISPEEAEAYDRKMREKKANKNP